MSAGIIGYDNAGDNNQPSPVVWQDSKNTLLPDLGLGYYKHAEFLAPLADTLALNEQRPVLESAFAIDCDDNTVFSAKAGEVGGYQDIETDGDDNDAVALFTEPLGKIQKGSGKKVWAEARIELGAITDQGLFFGLVEEAGASRDVVANNAGALIGESLVGFQILTDDQDGVDAVYRKDAGTVVEVASAVNNSTAIPIADRANLTANTEFKLGLRYDGRDTLYWYFNGVKVGSQTVDATVDQVKDYCVILGLKTGAAAAVSIAADWVRYAYQERT